MRYHAPPERLRLLALAVTLASACQQADQVLDLELDPGQAASVTIGAGGGTVSVPPSFSMRIPAGAYAGSVTAVARTGQPFPGDAGLPVPGTAFNVGPFGTPLGAPATVELAVPSALLAAGDEVRLGLALFRSDQSVSTSSVNFDVTNGILSAQVDELGPVAAVLLSDAIPVSLGAAPSLPGGSFSPGAPAPAPAPAAVDPVNADGVVFTARCSPQAQRCFSSGIVKVWADDVVRRRLGNVMYLVNAEVVGQLEFFDFGPSGLPRQVVGEIRLGGELRARIRRVVTKDRLDEVESTGLGPAVVQTGLSFQGLNEMLFAETSDDTDVAFEYGVSGIGTGELLTLRLDGEIAFGNGDLPDEIGRVVIHIRLRR